MRDYAALVIFEQYRLVTTIIKYYLPDHPRILAPEFVWQEYDKVPEFPQLNKFLDFWECEIEGKLHSVTVGHTSLILPNKYRYFEHGFDYNNNQYTN